MLVLAFLVLLVYILVLLQHILVLLQRHLIVGRRAEIRQLQREERHGNGDAINACLHGTFPSSCGLTSLMFIHGRRALSAALSSAVFVLVIMMLKTDYEATAADSCSVTVSLCQAPSPFFFRQGTGGTLGLTLLMRVLLSVSGPGCKTEFLGIIGIPWPAGARGPRGAPAAP